MAATTDVDSSGVEQSDDDYQHFVESQWAKISSQMTPEDRAQFRVLPSEINAEECMADNLATMLKIWNALKPSERSMVSQKL